MPVRTLDSAVAALAADKRISFVKLDVEGAESLVLSGATAALAQHRPVLQVELNDPLLVDAGSSSAELLRLCGEIGYVATGELPSLAGRVVDVLLIPTSSS